MISPRSLRRELCDSMDYLLGLPLALPGLLRYACLATGFSATGELGDAGPAAIRLASARGR
jgi:hypothetical protein